MKLRETIRYELWYQAASRVDVAVLLVLTALVFQLATEMQIGDAQRGSTPVNSPTRPGGNHTHRQHDGAAAIAAMTGEAAARDVKTGMAPLCTAPVGKADVPRRSASSRRSHWRARVLMLPVGMLLAVRATDVVPELSVPCGRGVLRGR